MPLYIKDDATAELVGELARRRGILGDCFAYACARTNEAKLLFKDDDFSKIDIVSALA
jgi:uncharacterized protein with PIN domain